MLTIGEVVSLDEKAEFRNDVQLDAFEDPAKNLALLNSYLFTNTAPNHQYAANRSVASVGLLDQIVQAFLSEKIENRLVSIANYGHGKSHLALALTNYFSKPHSSAEVQILLQKLDNALGDSPQKSRYHEFKKNRGEFLVVRLRGDQPHSLREQFMSNLEKALGEHEKTADIKPKFWYANAETFLSKLSGSELSRANQYLENRELDVPQLLYQVKNRQDVYDLCVNLFTHLYNVRPDFGGEVSLKNVVGWASNAVQVEGRGIGGILILFDEFSLYLERHGNRHAAAELMELLNGVEDNRGKVVFLAFAQQDPDTVAENIAMHVTARESLLHSLNRLPKSSRVILYSLMEGVIDAYLKQSDSAWQTLYQDPKIRGRIFQATDVAFEQFKGRYSDELHWPMEKFQETVTKGCFPLHPVTTALLCNLRYGSLRDTGVPRTVLGFVMEQLNRCKADLAIDAGKVNWVLPVHLVDYFEPRLQGTHYAAYQSAVGRLDGEAPLEYRAILKALLLQEIANIKARGDDQVLFLAHAAGLEYGETEKALKALVQSKCINYDPRQKVNSFWAPSVNPDKLEGLVKDKLETSPFTEDSIRGLIKMINDLPDITLDQATVPVEWGEPSDWAAKEYLLPAAFATRDNLEGLVERAVATFKEVSNGDRGCLLWFVADNQAELEWLREHFVAELDKIFNGDSPVPFVCVLPTEPNSDLIDAYRSIEALESFTQNERETVGVAMHKQEVDRHKLRLLKAFEQLRGAASNYLDVTRPSGLYRVPLAYRARVASLNRPSARTVLKTCYDLAYRNAPPSFFTQYKLNNAKQKSAVRLVGNLLLQNSPETLRQASQSDPVADQLCRKILQEKWQILSMDYRIQEPNSASVARAWQFLDDTFPPGVRETQIGEPLIDLLNPPHGYDFNTATLLFCAWFGYHSQDLQVSIRGQLSNRDALGQMLTVNGAKDFFADVCVKQPVALARRDPGEIVKEVSSLLSRIQRETFTQDEAQAAIATLREFSQDGRHHEGVRESAANGAKTLADGLGNAVEYDKQVTELQNMLSTTDLNTLTSLLNKVTKLPAIGIVKSRTSTASQVRQLIQLRIKAVVEQDCVKYENLQSLTQVDNHIAQLRLRKATVQKQGVPELVQRVEQAIQSVEKKAAEIQSAEREESVRVEISAMDTNSRLSKLYEHRTRLAAIVDQSESTMKLRNQRMTAVELEIESLEDKALGWLSQLNAVSDLKSLQQHFNDLLRFEERYIDSDLEQAVRSAQRQADVLREVLVAVGNIENSFSSIRTPEDVHRIQEEFNKLPQQSIDELSPAQQQKVQSLQKRIEQTVGEREKKALDWLSERKAEYQSRRVSAAELLQKLEKMPAFLPTYAKTELADLKQAVQQAIDEDAIAKIELQFLRISSLPLRQECLQRLEKLVGQQTAVPQ